jgi:chromatin segregation and condensation protein Rec8/ScpA/Scc1 (kleisin family)
LRGEASFFDAFARDSAKEEKIVAFLALLELIKMKRIKIWQERLFGEILMRISNDENKDDGTEDFGDTAQKITV